MTSRLQSSTRYIDYSKEFNEVVPNSVKKDEEAMKIWLDHTSRTFEAMNKLKELGIPTEDFTNKLPLSYESKMVLKINIRALMHMFSVRTCSRAYWEYRDFMKELRSLLSNIDEDWKYLCDEIFKTKCDNLGYCPEGEKFCCGRYKCK